jgi:HEAT repeat protein
MKRWLSLALLAVSGCGVSTLSNVALHEDLPSLRREIELARAKGELGPREVRELALAVATRELLSSKGDAGVARVREVRSCLGELESVLEERAEGTDAGAAAATLALLEAGRADAEELFERHREASDPNWRAVGARSAIGAEHGEFRRASFLHGDLRVRRAALQASLASHQEADRDAALEAARLDPDPLVRSLGVRVAGAIGGRSAVGGLRDLWLRAEEQTRQGMIDAWASPGCLTRGGTEQILWVMETQGGLPAIVAAARLGQSQGPHRAPALATLGRAITHGPVDEQRLALLLAPSDPDLDKAKLALVDSDDPNAAVMAAAVLAPVAAHREVALKTLRKLAQHRRVLISRQARAALVVMGEQSLAPALKRELDSQSAERRRQAAVDLLRLGRSADVATALGDAAATVRTRVACAILSAPR